MRVGYYKSGGLEVTLAPAEVTILMAGNNNHRLRAIVNPDSAKEWVRLEADPEAALRLGDALLSGSQSVRFRPMNAKAWPFFGAETVDSWSPGKGVLCGHRPKMNIPLIVRRSPNRKSPTPRSDQHQMVSEAVRIINNFIVANPEAEVAVSKEGRLTVRLYIEFGN